MLNFRNVISSVRCHLNLAFMTTQLRHSRHNLKPPTSNILHPHIPEPEHLLYNTYHQANLDPMQIFKPLHHQRKIKIESIRSGIYLGRDYPWNFLKSWRDWKRRRYNCTYHTSPWMISDVKGVHYNERLNCWSAQWHEDGVHRIRRFRAAFGLMKARENAEKFRLDLEGAGRVDNRRTERQMRLHYISKRSERQLRKQRFYKISSGQF